MNAIKKIMWPTDGGDSALRALDAAIIMAEKFNATLHALQVVEQVARPAQMGFAGDPMTAFDYPLYEEKLMESARENLQAIVSTKVPASITVEIQVELGLPRESIVSFCRSKDIDLIVMATHGREGFSHLWIGSVAESTVRQASVPVLVVPQKEKERKT